MVRHHNRSSPPTKHEEVNPARKHTVPAFAGHMDDVVGQPAGLASAWLANKAMVPQASACKECGEGSSNAGAAGTAESDAEMRKRRRMWHSIVLGQVLSVLIALMSMSAASLGDRGVNLPSFVNFINYTLITVCFLGPMLVRRRSLGLPWWRYAAFALVSIQLSKRETALAN